MKNTVKDLILRQNSQMARNQRYSPNEGQISVSTAAIPSETDQGTIFTVRIIAEPEDVEILDGKVIFEKRVLASSHDSALRQSGIGVIRS